MYLCLYCTQENSNLKCVMQLTFGNQCLTVCSIHFKCNYYIVKLIFLALADKMFKVESRE